MKLNLGCGGDIKEGWVNIDLYAKSEKVKRQDIRNLRYDLVEAILAQDVLEHLSHLEVEQVLKSWIDMLIPGGQIEIRCPDAVKQCQCLLDGTWSPETFSYMMFGGQDHEGNYHKSAFTMESLTGLLQRLGMRITKSEFRHSDLHRDRYKSSNPNLWVMAIKV